ncbi:MAG: CCA tRNA nucleotidyltransferase [Anaerolineae bacterium]
MDTEAQVIAWLAREGEPAYLVGGWVRDRLMGRPSYDVDVAVDGDGLALARKLADRLGGQYYPLDAERGAGRAILEAGRVVVDVARLRGPDLAADLASRDFTVNAMAACVQTPETVIDHHGGLADLAEGIIRPVSGDSIRNDPLRALRAVRLAAELGFALAPRTETLMQRDGPGLDAVSRERVRDELARLLSQPDASHWLRRLEGLGLLSVLFPELAPLRGMEQSPPHHLTGLDHSLAAVDALEAIVAAIDAGEGTQSAASPSPYPLPKPFLAPYGPRIREHLGQEMGFGRARLVILKLAALLHDTGKPATRTVEPPAVEGEDQPGRIRFFGHHAQGADLAAEALTRLRFNRDEVRLARTIVQHHMRPLLLADLPAVSSRAVYRFFRDTGDAGVDVLLHALADHLAIYAPGQDDGRWPRLLALTGRMLADYWDHRPQRVAPPQLIGGHDLLETFRLEPGPQIGELLEMVREAQVSGEVHSREEALALVRQHLAVEGSK